MVDAFGFDRTVLETRRGSIGDDPGETNLGKLLHPKYKLGAVIEVPECIPTRAS